MGTKKKQPRKRSETKKRARVVAARKSTPAQRKNDDIFGFMKGRIEIVGDIESPMEDWKYWDEEKNL